MRRIDRHAHVRVLVAFVTAMAVMIGVAPSASAEALPTTSVLYVYRLTSSDSVTFDVRVSSAQGPAEGDFVLSDGGGEVARGTLTADDGGRILYAFDAPLAATYDVTLDFLGNDDFAPSTVSAGPVSLPGTIASGALLTTGSIRSGAASVDFTDRALFVDSRRFYSPYSSPDFIFQTTSSALEPAPVVVPGVGEVRVGLGPYARSLTSTVAIGGALSTPTTPSDDVLGSEVWWVEVDGVRTITNCVVPTVDPVYVVSHDGTTLDLSMTGATADLDPSDCAGLGDIVDSVVGGTVEIDLAIDAPIELPIVETATTSTVLTVVADSFDGVDQVTLVAAVTSDVDLRIAGPVSFSIDGALFRTSSVSDGVASLTLPLTFPPGTTTFSAEYRGLPPFLASSDEVSIEFTGLPDGASVSGSIAFGDTASASFEDSGRLAGLEFSPETGALDSEALAFPVSFASVNVFGYAIDIGVRPKSDDSLSGTVAADGSVALDPMTFVIVSPAYRFGGGSLTALTDCAIGPFTVEFSGVADAAGLRVEALEVPIPPLAPGSCDGFASSVQAQLGDSVNLTLDVAGDFSRVTGAAASVSVVSWFPSVVALNQTYLVSRVVDTDGAPLAGVEVSFFDEELLLGTASTDADGVASLIASMDVAGVRTISASAPGVDGVVSGANTMVVSPAPVGFDVAGSLSVGGENVDLGEGAQLVPQDAGLLDDGAAGVAVAVESRRAEMWFVPTVVSLDLDGFGAVDAEVRLIQSGRLSAASVGAGGEIDGFNGVFALQVREVTTSGGTETSVGCVNVVFLAFGGVVAPRGTSVVTEAGGAARYPIGACTGASLAAIEFLTGELSLDLAISY